MITNLSSVIFFLGPKTRHLIYPKQPKICKIDTSQLASKKDEYNNLVNLEISNSKFDLQNPEELWSKISKIYISASEKICPIPSKPQNFSYSEEVELLSKKTKEPQTSN